MRSCSECLLYWWINACCCILAVAWCLMLQYGCSLVPAIALQLTGGEGGGAGAAALTAALTMGQLGRLTCCGGCQALQRASS